MIRSLTVVLAVIASGLSANPATSQESKSEGSQSVVPVALLPFQERGREVKEMGSKVTDLLFAKLAANPSIMLVEREAIEKLQKEQQLNLSGLVLPDQATRVGHLTGAKIIVTGSVVQSDKNLYLVAKVFGVETSRVRAASVKGLIEGSLDEIVDKLAQEVAKTLSQYASELIAPPVQKDDRIAAIKKALGDRERPTLYIEVSERHVGPTTLDPAAATEISMLCKQAGFKILDSTEDKSSADVVIKGEGFSEFAARHGELVSVKARLEIKAVDQKTKKLLAVDRQTTIAIDLSEQIAGRTALAEAAGQIAERLLPQIVQQDKGQSSK